DVEGAVMDEECGPELAIDGGKLTPGLAAIAGAKDSREGFLMLRGGGAEKVVRGDVVAVGQDGDAGRADVLARAGWDVVDDDTGDKGRGGSGGGVGEELAQ